MGLVKLPTSTRLFALLPLVSLASCAFGAGGTVGVHYTTDQSVRLQFELPLEVSLVGSGTTAAERRKPYVREAVIPQIFYDTKTGELDGGARIAAGPVFDSHGVWLAPAFTVGASSVGTIDIGLTMDLEVPFTNTDSCNDMRYNNLIAPQVSLTRHVYDDSNNHSPLSSSGGTWDVGIAVGYRRIHFMTCGGGSPPRQLPPTAARSPVPFEFD